MKNNSRVAKICSLAEKFDRVNNKSPIQLLREAGFSGSEGAISIEDIRHYLKNKTHLVESWFLYSMNKRTDRGWYFKKKNEVTYIVGYLPKGTGKIKESKYSDATQACATFIYNELFDIVKDQ
ncbi:MAG: hypothetical protein AB1481_07860 [Candidatus Omnitrophota bacterium]